MKYLALILLLASCSKIQQPAPIMPDLLQYNSNTNPVRMHMSPGEPSDTLMYFTNHINVIYEKPNAANGTNRWFICSGLYTLNVTALTINWTQGPLRGQREVLRPVSERNGFVRLESEFRGFWVKSN